MRRIKHHLPWQAKLAGKLIASRLPIPYSFWKRFGLYEHGFMEQPEFATERFLQHYQSWCPGSAEMPFIQLELGPGDSLLSGVIGKAFGAQATYLVDVGDFATKDVKIYRNAAQHLNGIAPIRINHEDWHTIDQILQDCAITYVTTGLEGLRSIPSSTISFAWSNAVFEHIKRGEVNDTLQELFRILLPGARSTHTIDLRDHFQWRLDNLRFSDDIWEGRLFSRSGFYTNRLRYSEFLTMAGASGFEVDTKNMARWQELPTRRDQMNHQFQSFHDSDLLIQSFELQLYKRRINESRHH